MSELVITLDPEVFRLSAVKKAAYRVGDRCYVGIETPPGGGIRVRLRAKSEGLAAEVLEGEFRNELLDQDLRERIAEETGGIRNLLLAQAFSGLAPADPASESADYRDDPLGIARPQAANQ